MSLGTGFSELTKIRGNLTRAEAIKALNVADRDQLIANLQLIGSKGPSAAAELRVGDQVAKHLGSPDPEILIAAAECLGNMGSVGAKYAGHIAGGTMHPWDKVRLAAIKALENFGPHALRCASVASRLAATDGESEEIRVVALQALGAMGAEDEFEICVKMLNSPSPAVVSAACVALGDMGETGLESSEEIAKRLSDDDTRYAALCALSKLGPKATTSAIDKIIDNCICDADLSTRVEAIGALGRMRNDISQAAMKKIVKMMGEKDPLYRAASCMALGMIGESAVSFADDVAKLLNDETEDFSWVPLQVGGGSARAQAPLRKPRCAALFALGMMKAETHASAVADLMESDDWEVRCLAAEALGSMGDAGKEMSSRVAELLSDDTYLVRAKACATLGALGAADQMDQLTDMFTDKAQCVRMEAVLAVGSLGDEGSTHATKILELLSDPSAHVRAGATQALGKIGETISPYSSCVASMLYDPAPNVRVSACVALGQLGEYGVAFADEISNALQDPVPDVRAQAATTLGDMGSEAMPFSGFLHMLKGDPDGDVSGAARRAIKAIGA